MDSSPQSSPRSLACSLIERARELQRAKRRSSEACFVALVLASLALYLTACQRVVLVSEASPIRIGPECESKVYTLTDDGWRLGDNRVRIPEGWYAVPPSFVEEQK